MSQKFRLTNVQGKLFLLSGLLLVLLAINALIGILQMEKIGEELKGIAEENLPLLEVFTEMEVLQLEQAILLEKMLRAGEVKKQEDKEADLARLEGELKKGLDGGDETIAKAEQLIDRLLQQEHAAAEKAEFVKLLEQLGQIEAAHLKYREHLTQLVEKIKAGEMEGIGALAHALEEEEEKLDQEMVQMVRELERFNEEAAHHAEEDEAHGITLLVGLGVFAMLLGLAVAYLIAKSIVGPLGGEPDEMGAIADKVAQGQLDIPRREGARGLFRSLLTMTDKIDEVVSAIRQNSQTLATATSELSATGTQIQKASEEVNQGIEDNAAALAQSSANTTKLAESIQSLNDTSQKVLSMVQTAQKGAQEGHEFMQATNQAIQKIADSARQIGGIINVITEISGQTNLLSLNAAIEAAKAGDSGKGFAVVAEEVRTLAERSAGAVEQIRQLIEVSSASVQEGTQVVGQTSDALATITGQVTGIAEAINGMVVELREQAAGAAELEQAIIDISKTGENHASAMTELASAMSQVEQTTGELSQMASQLNQQVEFFKCKTEA